MIRSDLTLYVSSPFNGGLFRLSTETGRVDVLQEYHGTGLCSYGGMLYQAVNGNSVYLLSPNGRLKRAYYLDDSYYHDLFVLNGGFGLVNTKRSYVEQYDTDFNQSRQFPEIYPGAMSVEDGCHLNSVRERHGKLYGCCFILANTSKAYRGNDENGVVFVQDGEVQTIADNLNRPHSIRLLSKKIVLCDSRKSELVFLTYSGEEIRRIPVMTKEGEVGFARGLLKVSGGWMVGLSSPRHGNGAENWVTGAHVVHITDNGALISSWKLPCHEVYDIEMIR